MNQNCAILLFGLLYKSDNGINDILVDDVLYVSLIPVEGEEAHAFDGGVIMSLSACTIDDMCNLIKRKPLNILFIFVHTCAIISSPKNMESVILVGIDIY